MKNTTEPSKCILLTGGTGYIGSHTAIVLAEAGYQVVLYDNLCNSSSSVVDRLQNITGQRMCFVQGDIRDTELLVQTLQAHQIGAVIHFAGLKAVGESVAKPIDYYANNVQGTISLLQAMQATNIKTLVFSSSAAVYGNPQYLPIDEAHPTSPANPYGRNKLQIEEILSDLVVSDEAWRIACLRYFNVVGAHESGLIGEETCGLPDGLMPYLVDVASGKLPHLNIFGNDYPTPDGTGVRDYIHVMDIADGHLSAINFLDMETGRHAINLGTGQGYSVLEMVKAFEAASGMPISHKYSPRRSGDIATCIAKVEKAEKLLKWRAARGLNEMCSTAWCWQVNKVAL